MAELKIEVGKKYKDGNGDEITIVKYKEHQGIFIDEDDYGFYPNGVFAYYEDKDYDLIEEVKD